jgi:hypothetical protein
MEGITPKINIIQLTWRVKLQSITPKCKIIVPSSLPIKPTRSMACTNQWNINNQAGTMIQRAIKPHSFFMQLRRLSRVEIPPLSLRRTGPPSQGQCNGRRWHNVEHLVDLFLTYERGWKAGSVSPRRNRRYRGDEPSVNLVNPYRHRGEEPSGN